MCHRATEGGEERKAVVTSSCYFDIPFTFISIISPFPLFLHQLDGGTLVPPPLSNSYANGCDRQCASIFYGRQYPYRHILMRHHVTTAAEGTPW